MATARLLNVDEEGNILSPQVLARLTERFGAAGGITPTMTLNELAALSSEATAAQEGA